MRVIGLTGGIASGKSTVAALLRARGAHIIDADQIAHEIVRPGQPALAEIIETFGRDIIGADGTLDRKALGALIFGDATKRSRLNQITHPRVAAETARQTAEYAAAGADLVIYDVPLLVENGLHRAMAGVVVVAADPEVQRTRLKSRNQLSESEINERISAQLPLAAKIAVADYVVANDGTLADTERQVDHLWRLLQAGGPKRALHEAPLGIHLDSITPQNVKKAP